jgi:hypothetical protein
MSFAVEVLQLFRWTVPDTAGYGDIGARASPTLLSPLSNASVAALIAAIVKMARAVGVWCA